MFMPHIAKWETSVDLYISVELSCIYIYCCIVMQNIFLCSAVYYYSLKVHVIRYCNQKLLQNC